jgi:hypothetical protein
MILKFPHFTLDVKYTYSPGTPDVMYLPNGDPGYPGDPPECVIASCRLILAANPTIYINLESIGFLDEFSSFTEWLYTKVEEDLARRED